MTGTVFEIRGEWNTVQIENGDFLKARLKGKLRLTDEDHNIVDYPTAIAVGDKVALSSYEDDWIIHRIIKRDNYFARYIERTKTTKVLASNIDQVVIMACLVAPYVPFIFIDSAVITAITQGIKPIICFNKQDLYRKKDKTKLAYYTSIYGALGYEVIELSITEKWNVDKLKPFLIEKKSFLLGFSGCGKSTLINYLLPELEIPTSEVSKQQLGVHTTTFSKMYDLPDKTSTIIDSPGIRTFNMPFLPPKELRMYFKEFLSLQPECNFVDCTHIHEEKCAVLDALSDGKIANERYFTYRTNFDYLTKLYENIH